VTNWVGSNVADLVVVLPEDACRQISVHDEIAGSLGPGVLPSAPNHIYYEAKRWRTPEVLEFHVWGDTGVESRKDFDQDFEYTIGGRVRRADTCPAAEPQSR
jgi:hypothetical protein